MNNEQLNYQLGHAKLESFSSRLTPHVLSSMGGKVIWIHDELVCSIIKMDKCSIQKAIKNGNTFATNREISDYADSILDNEYRYLKTHQNEVLALTSTPYGVYISIIAAT
jgi:hypothetical protein